MIEKTITIKESDFTTTRPEKSQLDASSVFGWYILFIFIVQPLWYIFCVTLLPESAPEFILWLPVLISFVGIFFSGLYRGMSGNGWSLVQFSFAFLFVSVIYFMLLAFAGFVYALYFLGVTL